jgi:catechol 2,3-dioxygenase
LQRLISQADRTPFGETLSRNADLPPDLTEIHILGGNSRKGSKMTDIVFPKPSTSRVETVTLLAIDPTALTAFYADIVGLEPLKESDDQIDLGVDGQVYLRILTATQPRPVGRTAGLFHTAFLLPDRRALASWVNMAIARRIQLEGASDHAISEAFYLTDPEGNGLEIYADRSPAEWKCDGEAIYITSDALNLPALIGMTDVPQWTRMPTGSIIGHVHLSVDTLEDAEAFYVDRQRMDVTARYPGAAFLSWEGYHHHIAINTWGHRGVPTRTEGQPGLDEIVLTRLTNDAIPGDGVESEIDPSTGVRFTVQSRPYEASLQSPRAAISAEM